MKKQERVGHAIRAALLDQEALGIVVGMEAGRQFVVQEERHEMRGEFARGAFERCIDGQRFGMERGRQCQHQPCAQKDTHCEKSLDEL